MSAERVLELDVGGQVYPVRIPGTLLIEAEDFFAKLDRDMDRGWQMGRLWVEQPDAKQRCQIVADRILTALHKERSQLVGLASAYILRRMPGVRKVRINTDGEMTETAFEMG